MRMKVVAGCAFLLNTFLFGSYYAVSKEMLGRIDPIVFAFLMMMTLVPPAILILALSWRHMTRAAARSGFLLGSCQCLGLVALSVALKYNSATGTAFFPSLNGLLAALFAWLFLRQPVTRKTWCAGAVSVVGAVLLIANASIGGVRGALIAFIGGLFLTAYIFLADHEQNNPAVYWPLFGVELLTMALWANLIALLFGDWGMGHFDLPKDIAVVLYAGLGTTFLPTLCTVLLQKYISPVTVSFIYILEPVQGAIVAFLYLHEVLPLVGYIGGGLIVAGTLINTWSTTVRHPATTTSFQHRLALAGQYMHSSLLVTLVYPAICCCAGLFIVYRLGGFPPAVWYELLRMGPQLSSLVHAGRGMDVFMIVAQSASWFIAWVSLFVLACLATYRALEKLFVPPAPLPSTPIELDTRLLRQMGYTPYATPTNRRPLSQRHGQRGRVGQRVRLVRPAAMPITPPRGENQALAGDTRMTPLPDENEALPFGEVVMRANHEHHHDQFGNRWAYWDDIGKTGVREQ